VDKSKSINLVVFDFDGTLVDLHVDWTKVKNDCIKLLISEGLNSNITPFGQKINTIIESLRARGEEEYAKKIKDEINRIIEREELHAKNKAKLKEGALQLLLKINTRCKTALLSDNGKQIISYITKKYKLPPFDMTICRDDVKFFKPNAEGINIIQKSMKIFDNECLLIGNSDFDFMVAESVNSPSIILKNSNLKLARNVVDSPMQAYDTISRVLK